jgi:hypothetical protein
VFQDGSMKAVTAGSHKSLEIRPATIPSRS